MNKEFLHMQKLAGIITESEYKAKINENELSVGDTVNLPDESMGRGKIMLVTGYAPYADEIDKDIEMSGWESGTPREELTFFKVKADNGETYWFDEEELKVYN